MAAAIPYALMAVQAVGAIQQASAAASNANSQASMSDYNAQVSRNNADAALKSSTSQQLAQNRQARQQLGVQRAAAAQSGLGFTGSNRDIIDRSETLAELDQLNLAYEGQLKASGFLAQAGADEYGAKVYRRNAASAGTAGLLGAASAIGGGLYRMGGASTKSVVPAPNMSLNGSYSVYG